MKTLILSTAFGLALVSTGVAGGHYPFCGHYRLVPNDRNGFDFYDGQGYGGWIDQNGYFDNQGTGFRHWLAPFGEMPELPEMP